jgi:hypothetical protein
MKIWNSFGSEHSANLVIIGTFKTPAAAQEASKIIDELSKIAADCYGQHQGHSLAKPMFDAVLKHNVGDITVPDAESLSLDFHVTTKGNTLEISTDETDIQALLKLMLRHDARIQVYSAHAYPKG